MKREIAEAWVADLRTNPPQATGRLYDGTGHCCLGRLCLVIGATFGHHTNEYHDGEYYPVLDGETLFEHEVLPREILNLAGIRSQSGIYGDAGKELTDLNDNGATFAEIAVVIEENWESL